MVRFSRVKPLGALALLLTGTAVQADVTAQQVWDKWSEQMEIYGGGFTSGEETLSGDTLTIADVKIEMSDDMTGVLAEMGDITLTETGDGSVNITIADSYPIKIDFTPDNGGDQSAINLLVNQTGLVLKVSGEPEEMVFDFQADSYSIGIDSIEGDAATEMTIEEAAVTMRDSSGQYSIHGDDLTHISYNFDVGAIDLNVSLLEIEGDGTIKGNATFADLAMFAEMILPKDLDLNAEQPPFEDGLALNAGYNFGNINYAFDINVDNEIAAGDATIESGQIEMKFDYDQMAYTGGAQGIDLSISIPNEIPFPIEAAMARYGFDFQIPLSQSEDGPRDARIAFDLTDLAVSNSIWNLLDPAEILPRDTFTVALGLDAQVTPFFDVLDPDQQESMLLADVPGELHNVTLTELIVRAGGAEITGNGAFAFDNADLESFDGFPRPEGKAEFEINGINGLVDKLIQMGIIPEEDALMPRMMLGMFATPVGDDMLTSTIEVNSEGHVLANGQRLR